jgi:hypothetical protein
MKYFAPILAIIAALFISQLASAQISIDEVNAGQNNVTFRDELKPIDVNVEYFSLARYKAERAAIRKERNYLEIGGGLQGALVSQNDPWIAVSGGDNTISVVANLFLHHTFTKNNFIIDTRFNANLGYNRMKVETANAAGGSDRTGIWFKNQDEFVFSTAPGFKMAKNWSYGATIAYRSQFAKGYRSRTQQTDADRKSQFMTPGYLDISLGVTYRSPNTKYPFTVNIAPLAMSATYVANDMVRRDNGFLYGIEDPDNRSKYEGGSSVKIDFDRTFGKTGFLRYRTTLFSFYGWITCIGQKNKISNYTDYTTEYNKWADPNDTTVGHTIKNKPHLPIHPTVRWENAIDIKATKYLTTTVNFQLFYNRAQNLDVQTRTLLSVGLTYTFKNK